MYKGDGRGGLYVRGGYIDHHVQQRQLTQQLSRKHHQTLGAVQVIYSVTETIGQGDETSTELSSGRPSVAAKKEANL